MGKDILSHLEQAQDQEDESIYVPMGMAWVPYICDNAFNISFSCCVYMLLL